MSNKSKYCKVCCDAGKSDYRTHNVNENGVTVCPTLLGQSCGYCRGSGHTVKFCPELKRKSEVREYREERTASRREECRGQESKYCKVCCDAGKSDYRTHNVKENGVTVCPTLLSQSCGYCHGSGHTVKFCPELKRKSEGRESSESRNSIARSEVPLRASPVVAPVAPVASVVAPVVVAQVVVKSEDSEDSEKEARKTRISSAIDISRYVPQVVPVAPVVEVLLSKSQWEDEDENVKKVVKAEDLLDWDAEPDVEKEEEERKAREERKAKAVQKKMYREIAEKEMRKGVCACISMVDGNEVHLPEDW